MLNVRSAPGAPIQLAGDGSLLVNLADDFDREQLRRGQHVIVDDVQYIIRRRRLNKSSVRLVLAPVLAESREPQAESSKPEDEANAE